MVDGFIKGNYWFFFNIVSKILSSSFSPFLFIFFLSFFLFNLKKNMITWNFVCI